MNFGEMQQQTLDAMGAGDNPSPKLMRMAKNALNAELGLVYARFNWKFLYVSGQLAFTSATESVALPTGWRGVVSASIGATGAPLGHKDLGIETAQRGAPSARSRGSPQFWDVIGDRFYVMPYADGDYSIQAWGVRSLGTGMVDSTDTPLFDPTYHMVVVDGGIARLTADDSHDPVMTSLHNKRRDEMLLAMMHTAQGAVPYLQNIKWLQGNI